MELGERQFHNLVPRPSWPCRATTELGIRVTGGMGWKPLEAHGTAWKPLLVILNAGRTGYNVSELLVNLFQRLRVGDMTVIVRVTLLALQVAQVSGHL